MMDFSDLIDSDKLEPIVDIDLGVIETNSNVRASGIVRLISRIYKDSDFLENNKDIHERLEIDLQTIKELIKSKSINEALQDSLVTAIAGDSGNEKLYTVLNNLQKTQLAIGERLDKVIAGLREILESHEEEDQRAVRGRKAFIQRVNS